MGDARLSRLVSLAAAAAGAAQARMSALKTEELRLTEQLQSLLKDRRSHAATDRAVGDAALNAGADIRWHRWIDGRVTQLNMELALNRSAQARAKDDLRRLLGRENALAALAEKMERQDHTRRERRGQWDL